MTVDVDGVLRPHFEALMAAAGRPALFDAHTHIGRNDPDGYKQEPEELLAALAAVDARGLVFPMHEPDGYPEANDRVVAVAKASDGRLAALCRVDPNRADTATQAWDSGSPPSRPRSVTSVSAMKSFSCALRKSVVRERNPVSGSWMTPSMLWRWVSTRTRWRR